MQWHEAASVLQAADLDPTGARRLAPRDRRLVRGTPVEVGYATLNDEPPEPTGAPPGLARVIRRCLEKLPGERFQSWPSH